MSQSRIDSVLEALTNIAIGAGIALLTQLLWFPAINKQFTLTENLATTAVFTAVSFLRSYSIRRLFSGKTIYQAIKCKLKSRHYQATRNSRQMQWLNYLIKSRAENE